jgi:hypothetical protein
MQVTIRFNDRPTNKSQLYIKLFQLALNYVERPKIIGNNLGIGITNSSWEDAYRFISESLDIILEIGATAFWGLTITTGDDVEEKTLAQVKEGLLRRKNNK